MNAFARSLLTLLFISNIPLFAVANDNTTIAIPDIAQFNQEVAKLNSAPNTPQPNYNHISPTPSTSTNNTNSYIPPAQTQASSSQYHYAPTPTAPSSPAINAAPQAPVTSPSSAGTAAQKQTMTSCTGGICFGDANDTKQQSSSNAFFLGN